MKLIKTLLACAVAAASGQSLAMQEIEDVLLSEMTAQDGIRVTFNTPGVNFNATLNDTDGIQGTAYTFDGAIAMEGGSLVTNVLNPFVFDIDGGSSAVTGGTSVLNISGSIPAFAFTWGSMFVANSGRDEGGWYINTPSAVFLEPMTFTTTQPFLFNVQLGNEFQTGVTAGTDLVNVNFDLPSSNLTISGFRLNDVSSGGRLGFGSTILGNWVDPGLTINFDVNVLPSGLQFSINQLGRSGYGVWLLMQDAYIGTNEIGDVAVWGLQLRGPTTIIVSGK